MISLLHHVYMFYGNGYIKIVMNYFPLFLSDICQIPKCLPRVSFTLCFIYRMESQKSKRSPNSRHLLTRVKRFLNKRMPHILDFISPLWFLTTVMGLNYMATDHIAALLYGETIYSSIILGLAWFMSAQMVINWLLMAVVNSDYINTAENNAKRQDYEKSHPELPLIPIDYKELRERTGLTTANWSVITDYTGGTVVQTAYPYWGWKPCVPCSFTKPPRCHHCPICDKCVLKRDHHCFFARNCIGLKNQRFFIVFNLWGFLLVTFALPQLLYYVYTTVWPSMSYLDLFLPCTLLLYLFGFTPFYTLALVFEISSVAFFIPMTLGFLYEQLMCVNEGRTSFERDQDRNNVQTLHRTRTEKFSAVFGSDLMWLNLLFPMHWISTPTDDGIQWESMKID